MCAVRAEVLMGLMYLEGAKRRRQRVLALANLFAWRLHHIDSCVHGAESFHDHWHARHALHGVYMSLVSCSWHDLDQQNDVAWPT